MILRFILFALGIYVIYKVIFELVIPVVRTTQKIRQQFGAMQQHMQDQMNTQHKGAPQSPKPPANPGKTSSRAEDYIDFEEVKS